MEYKVIPFVASLDPKKGNSSHVAKQLENIISEYAKNGWSYVRLESVTTYVKSDGGCFGFGASSSYTTAKQIIVFSK